MKARPILFSAPMIRALFDGRKTQTRRIIKPQPGPNYPHFTPYLGAVNYDGPLDRIPAFWLHSTDKKRFFTAKCPYGRPGDLLWVRETFWHYGKWLRNGKTKTGKQKWKFRPVEVRSVGEWIKFDEQPKISRDTVGFHKRPSIFMPRWGSRLTLEITYVRAQRLQNISEGDAQAEGCDPALPVADRRWVCGYQRLWGHINGPESWEENPWCWALIFKVHKRNVDALLAQKAA